MNKYEEEFAIIMRRNIHTAKSVIDMATNEFPVRAKKLQDQDLQLCLMTLFADAQILTSFLYHRLQQADEVLRFIHSNCANDAEKKLIESVGMLSALEIENISSNQSQYIISKRKLIEHVTNKNY